MKQIFKDKDAVFYGTVSGILLGIFNSNQALFFSNEPRVNFSTIQQLKQNISDPRWNVVLYFITEYFQCGKPLPPGIQKLLEAPRFKFVSLQELKLADNNHLELHIKELIRKRHLNIIMAHSYLKAGRMQNIDKVYQRIENIQLEIETKGAATI